MKSPKTKPKSQASNRSQPKKPRQPQNQAAPKPARKRPLTAVMNQLWTKSLRKQQSEIRERAKARQATT